MDFAWLIIILAAIIFGATISIVAIYYDHKTKMEMLKRGYVPNDYHKAESEAGEVSPQPRVNMQPSQPRYELPQLPDQGAPMPFSNEQAKNQPLYDLPTSNISRK